MAREAAGGQGNQVLVLSPSVVSQGLQGLYSHL